MIYVAASFRNVISSPSLAYISQFVFSGAEKKIKKRVKIGGIQFRAAVSVSPEGSIRPPLHPSAAVFRIFYSVSSLTK